MRTSTSAETCSSPSGKSRPRSSGPLRTMWPTPASRNARTTSFVVPSTRRSAAAARRGSRIAFTIDSHDRRGRTRSRRYVKRTRAVDGGERTLDVRLRRTRKLPKGTSSARVRRLGPPGADESRGAALSRPGGHIPSRPGFQRYRAPPEDCGHGDSQAPPHRDRRAVVSEHDETGSPARSSSSRPERSRGSTTWR